jgi:16S rRNA (uracil1498-N3)-methyltransferase
MIKIFVDKAIKAGDVIEIVGANHHHLQVVHVDVEDEILVGAGNFGEYIAQVISVTKKGYTVKIKSKSQENVIPVRKITLYISLPKKKKLEDIIFKCTQVGISEFIPMTTSRTIKKIKEKNMEKILDRWKKKARYGAELSGRKIIPSIKNIINFNDAVKDYRDKKFDSGILFWEEEGNNNYITENDLSDKMAVFIGPEGGFSETETNYAKDNGLKIRSMGKLVMDVETACIAASALVLCTGK